MLRGSCLFFLALAACSSIPQGTAAVDTVNVEGNKKISSSDLEDKIATTESPKFLGLLRGVVVDYSLFDRHVLERDLSRVERYYRARGFYEAHARAGRVVHRNDKHVEVTIEVEEGQPVLVREVVIRGVHDLPEADLKAVRLAIDSDLSKGKRFDEDVFQKSETSLKKALTDRGYAYAKVQRTADVDLPGHDAEVAFDVFPGPKATFGEVTIEGLEKVPEPVVRRALDLAPGGPYSTRTLQSAEQALLDLGAFSSVEIVPSLPEPPPPDRVVPVRVKVVVQKLHGVELGGGVELDEIQTNLHLTTAWEDRNFLGGLRHFRVEFKPGVVLYPTRLPEIQAPTAILPEEKTRFELRQPGLFEARTNGLFRAEFNAYPLLLTPHADPDAPVIGYIEAKGSAGLERTFGKIYANPSYNIQYVDPFAYKGDKDPDLVPIVVSYLELINHIDLRNDAVHPHKGIYLQTDIQGAGLGGAARDVRFQPEIRAYIPIAKKVTGALRGTFGLLFPMNYGSTLRNSLAGPPDDASRAAWVKDVEITYLRGFFSGGPSSNRGYPLQAIGPHGAVPFLNPNLAAQQIGRSCDPTNADYDPVRCAAPLGGDTLWELSAELRVPIEDPLGAVLFCDSSDVAPNVGQFRFNHLHLSCGLGLRYDTPVGPVRADVGYRIPGAQVIGEQVDPRIEGDPGTVFGAPIAIALGIGEAF